MLIKKPTDIRPSDITPRSVFEQRRRLIKGVGGIAGGLAASSLAPVAGAGYLDWLLGRSPSQPRGAALPNIIQGALSDPLTPNRFEDITGYNNFYEFGTDKSDPARHAHQLTTQPWHLTVGGACRKPGRYDLEDFLKPHQLEERIYRFRCVEAWSMVVPWVGIPLGALLKRFEPTANAKYVQFKTLYRPSEMRGQRRRPPIIPWPYLEGLRMDEAQHPLTLMVVGLYGETLPNQNGAPLRLIVPWKYGFKSIKSIVSIEFLETQPINSWQQQAPREYGFYANVNPAVDHPRWSQARERRLGEWTKTPTLPFNGYAEQVAHLYAGMDPRQLF